MFQLRKKDKKRETYNKKIIQEITKYLEKYPYMRFGQALYALRILIPQEEDIFYEEPDITHERMRKEI